MSAFANLVVADSTPTNHTLTPRDKNSDGVCTWVERGTVSIDDIIITAQVRDLGSSYKVRIKSSTPTVVTPVISGVNQPVVDSTDYADTTFTFAKKRTDTERAHFVARHKNAMGSAAVNIYDMLIKQESAF